VSQGREPIRTCAGCRKRHPQRTMVRFTPVQHGWVADKTTRRPGRGVYLCSSECAEAVAKNKRFPGLSQAAEFLRTGTNMIN